MNCPNCGHENPEGNAFCEHCGAPAEAPADTPIEMQRPPAQPDAQPATVQPAIVAGGDPAPSGQPPAGQAPADAHVDAAQPGKSRTGAAIAIVVGAVVAVAVAFWLINAQHQANLPVVYGTFSDSRPASDEHGRFLSFQVDEDAASSDSSRHFAIISTEWTPGKYDLDGYEVELENDHIDIVARVELRDEGDKVTFTPAETLTDGIDWQVSGSFDNTSVTLEEGYWTIETSDGQNVPVLVDNLTLPYGNVSNA